MQFQNFIRLGLLVATANAAAFMPRSGGIIKVSPGSHPDPAAYHQSFYEIWSKGPAGSPALIPTNPVTQQTTIQQGCCGASGCCQGSSCGSCCESSSCCSSEFCGCCHQHTECCCHQHCSGCSTCSGCSGSSCSCGQCRTQMYPRQYLDRQQETLELLPPSAQSEKGDTPEIQVSPSSSSSAINQGFGTSCSTGCQQQQQCGCCSCGQTQPCKCCSSGCACGKSGSMGPLTRTVLSPYQQYEQQRGRFGTGDISKDQIKKTTEPLSTVPAESFDSSIETAFKMSLPVKERDSFSALSPEAKIEYFKSIVTPLFESSTQQKAEDGF